MAISPDNPGLFTLALLPNPFPVTRDGYNDSLWFTWIERVMLSHDAHVDDIVAAHGGSDRIENQQQQEDADTLFTITESMYAAVIVAAQSRIEVYYQKVCDSIYIHINRTHELYAINSKEKASKLIKGKELEKYVSSNTGVKLRGIENYNVADSVRVLSNIFKHNSWKYTPERTNIIDPVVATAIGVVPNRRVTYSNLPLRDILIGCGRYCQNLKQSLMQVFSGG